MASSRDRSEASRWSRRGVASSARRGSRTNSGSTFPPAAAASRSAGWSRRRRSRRTHNTVAAMGERLCGVTDRIDTTEMYLRTIYELVEEGIVPLRARIAERLGHSGPTVSQTVARMQRDGLLSLAGDRHLELSAQGRQIATRVMRKHRLAERLLLDVVGLEWEYVHEEACRWEHVMSERVERKILTLIGEHRESPYGNPIPGLDELGEEPNEAFRLGVTSLLELAGEQPAVVVVRRIGEPA